MDDLNVVIMIGRLVFDPEVKEGKSGKKKVKLRIAVSRGKDAKSNDKGAYFFNAQAYGKTADAIAKYGTKGRLVSIQGKLCEWSYDKDEEKRYYTVINIDAFRLLDRPKERAGESPQGGPAPELYDDSKGKSRPMNEAARRAQERTGAATAARGDGPTDEADSIPF